MNTFATFLTEIEEKLSGLSDVKEDLNLAFDELNMAIQKLQKFVSDSVLFLPSYNLQSSQQVLCLYTGISMGKLTIILLHSTNFLAEENFGVFLIRNFWRVKLWRIPACLLSLYIS